MSFYIYKGGKMMKYCILNSENNANSCGGKAYGLFLLNSVGLQIPETLIVPKGIRLPDYKQKIRDFLNGINSEYNDVSFAVRSSASNEDGVKNSWAGIYETKLSIPISEVYESILEMYCYTDSASQALEWINENI